MLGISVSEEKNAYASLVLDITQSTASALELDVEITKKDVVVFDEYLGDGYGEVNADVAGAIRLMSMKEGIFLDPVYTGKAMVALIDLVEKGYFEEQDNVVFFHTGGTPAIFPNKKKLGKYLSF